MTKQYDVVVLGGGTGGYVAAIRAADYGLSVAIVEKEKLGGTCLHKGCIPTKSLLKSVEMLSEAKKLSQYGVFTNDITFDYSKMLQRKNDIVDTLHRGVNSLVSKASIDVYTGTGTILGPSIFSPLAGTISVTNGEDEPEMLLPNSIIIATGTRPKALPFLPFDGQRVLNSDNLLQLHELPSSIMIVGGGVIGVEWSSILSNLGVTVTLLEAGETILPTEDVDIQQEMTKLLKATGVNIIMNAEVNNQTLKLENGVTFFGKEQISAEICLIAIGREACTNGIGIENTNIELENGFIQVNEHYQTKEKHMFAIGDCIGGLQLAHVASSEGLAAVEYMVNKNNTVIESHLVPKCIYSSPQIASVGLTENAAKERYGEILVKKVPFSSIGKAHCNGSTIGFMKVITEKVYGEIIGIHAIGKDVTELISEGALAMTMRAVPEEISETVHPHPTLSEIYLEASFALQQKGIHL